MKIATVGHFSKMMPLLIRWSNATDTETRAGAMDLLTEVASLTWPRTSQMHDLQGVLTKYRSGNASFNPQGSQI